MIFKNNSGIEFLLSYENYRPRGKDVEKVLNEIKEIVLYLSNEALAKGLSDEMKRAFRSEMFLNKLEQLVPSSFVSGMKRSNLTVDKLMERVLYRRDVLDAYFLEKPKSNETMEGAETLPKVVEKLVDMKIGSKICEDGPAARERT